MLAARDQENLVHTHQTTAASKPLNQGIKALQPKTPGNNFKTPFRARNDENKPLATGKAEKNAFITPAPRIRAPLGAKTTNAKAQPFKTPAPTQKNLGQERTVNKHSTGRRSAKSKIVVAPTEPVQASLLEDKEEEDDEPDYGYAPPPEIPLPDPPLEITYDDNFPNLTAYLKSRDYLAEHFGSPKDENGLSIRIKEMDRKAQQEQEQEMLKQIQAENHMKFPDPDEEVAAMVAAGPKNRTSKGAIHESRVNTVKARSAAAALSEPHRDRNTRPLTTSMGDTASSMQRKKPTFTVSKDTAPTSKPIRSAPPPVSKNTIGFPKAKKAPSILPSPQRVRAKPTPMKHQSFIDPQDFVELYGQPPAGSEMWLRLQDLKLGGEEDTAATDQSEEPLFDFDLSTGPFKLDGVDDVDNFQLPIPED